VERLLFALARQTFDPQRFEVIVVADSTKFGRQSLAHLCPLTSVKTLVADEQLSTEWREIVTALGVELVIASIGEPQPSIPSQNPADK